MHLTFHRCCGMATPINDKTQKCNAKITNYILWHLLEHISGNEPTRKIETFNEIQIYIDAFSELFLIANSRFNWS